MFGARPFPASVRMLARLSRRSAGNSGRGSEAGVDLIWDCVLLYFSVCGVDMSRFVQFFFVFFCR